MNLFRRSISLSIRWRRAIAVTLSLACLNCAIAAASTNEPKESQTRARVEKRPNLLMIYIDDMGWRDVGFMGSDFYETPNLDQLAGQAMVFSDAYSCAANCAPARACLLSGQYTPRHKIYNVGTRARGKSEFRRLQHIPGTDTLDPSIKTWAQQLKSAGYKTATIGKWHLSDDPLPFGFDLNIGGSHGGSPPKGYYPPHPDAPGLEDASQDEYLTDRLSDEACKFIEANRDQPWMLYLTHFAVHTPIQAKRDLVAKYRAKPSGTLHQSIEMATMVQAVDDGVGKLMDTLQRLKLADNTILIFYSDNGGHGPVTDMAPLRGHKGTYYEGGIRVPFFVHWPGHIQAGKSSEPISGVDLFPTLCELAGAELPDQPLDGKSLVPMLTGKTKTILESGSRPLFWHFPAYLESSRNAELCAEQRDPIFRSRPCSLIRKGNWKLIEYFETGDIELFDLESDIGESRNLVTEQPDVALKLLEELRQWQMDIKADIPRTKNLEFDADAEAKLRAKLSSAKLKR